ncbi:MAG: ComEC/Rec2 family competence protein [Aquificaceae bacterium]|nr:ComEC/Rec2 family competence protein [Aquificaceae bacterium]MDW8096916.1 ComEC/Rec2 family competence protein [Aquificaceae bacterium]
MRWWWSRKGFLDLSTFSLPEKGELFQLLLLLGALFLALWRVEKENRFLWFEEEDVLVQVVVLSPPYEVDFGLRATVKVTGGELPELYGRRAVLTLYGTKDVPSKGFSLRAKVRAEERSFFISGSYRDIQEVGLYQTGVRELYIRRVEQRLEDQEIKALTLSYLFGESQETLPQDMQYYFLKTGLVHLLVISGFHVAMVFFVLRYLMPYPYGPLLGVIGVSLYVLLLVPQEPPVLRAWLMLLLWVLVRLQQGVPNTLNILLLSASVLLFFRPEFVHSYSFWLSFFATLYILLGLRLLPEGNSALYRYLLQPLGVSFFAFLGVSPLLLSFTHTSMGSVIFSPLVGYMFFPFTVYGILQILTFFSLPSFPLELLGKLILKTVSLLSVFDLSVELPLSTQFAYGSNVVLAVGMYIFGKVREKDKV